MRFMENAVRFEQNDDALRVKYQMTVDGVNDLELSTVMNAMDVSKCVLGLN